MRVILSRTKKKIIIEAFKIYDFITDSDKSFRLRMKYNGFDNPDYFFEKDEIAFIHIPKTGGTTISKVLNNHNQLSFVNLNIHKPVSLHCSPMEYKYFTVLRNPVDRVWSQFQMILREGKGYPHYNFANRGLVTYLKKCREARNFICRYFTGEIDKEPNDKTLEKAENNLKAFYWVIDFNQFNNEFAEFLINHEIPVDKVPNERKASYQKPTEEEINLIEEYNQLDLMLYSNYLNSKFK